MLLMKTPLKCYNISNLGIAGLCNVPVIVDGLLFCAFRVYFEPPFLDPFRYMVGGGEARVRVVGDTYLKKAPLIINCVQKT